MQELSTDPKARCPHFGSCGGCEFQDVAYPEQLARKSSALSTLFDFCWSHAIPVEASPVIWHYRNKVDPAFGGKHYDEPPPKGFQRETVLGFKPRGRWFGPIEIGECHIGPEGLAALLGSVQAWQRASGYRYYDTRSGAGFLRVLLVRDAKRTGQRMVVLITAEGDLDATRFVDCVQTAFPSHSIQHAVFRGRAQIAAADELRVLYGAPDITEILHVPDGDAAPARKLSLRVSPFSFLQTNTLAAERLYAIIRAWMKQVAPSTVYDLYGGMGSIAFVCSDLAGEVHSVENVPEASADGRHNARANGIDNVVFHTMKVEDYLHGLAERQQPFADDSAVVLDPPRAGMHPRALRCLLELAPRRFLYVSCKPTVLAQEMASFLETYRIADMRAVDLFPHTPHVELVVQFERR